MIYQKLSALALLPLLLACGTADSSDEAWSPEPHEKIAEAPVENPPLPDAITNTLASKFSDFAQLNYRYGKADLNGDGPDEWLVFVTGPGVCGSGGCPLMVYAEAGGSLKTLGRLSVAQMPVGVYSSQTKGWRDLAVTIGGGGIAYSVAKVPFDGEAYASNPTVAPAEPGTDEFTTVIALPEAS